VNSVLKYLLINSFKKNGPKIAIIFLKRGEIISRASFSELDEESNRIVSLGLHFQN